MTSISKMLVTFCILGSLSLTVQAQDKKQEQPKKAKTEKMKPKNMYATRPVTIAVSIFMLMEKKGTYVRVPVKNK